MNPASPAPPPPAAPDAAAGPALDPATLARLHALDPGGKAGVVVRVLRAFEASLVRHIDEALVLQAAQDAQGLGRLAHTLKSSSASVGALELSKVCADIERSVRDHGTPASGLRVAALIHESRVALQAVRAILPT